MPREFSRSDRVSAQMQRELAELIQRELKDPRLGLVTISDVEVSRDLAVAKVYVSFLGASETIKQNIDRLSQQGHFLRRELGRRMRLRIIPELRFIYDDSIERGSRLASILGHLGDDASDKH
jgi:ribosome-binding factor A